MEDGAIGRGFRALRMRKGWTQQVLASRVGVRQSVVSDLETGHLDRIRLPTIRRIGRELGMFVELAPRWPIADVARLLDAGHARLVERVVRLLLREGWEVIVEYTFNEFGDRGSVDVLAWHARLRALLIIEVKTRLADIQATHAAFDKKVRVVPKLVARERGWRPATVGRLLVVAATHGNRTRVREHAATFGSFFPARSRTARQWIRDPVGPLAGLWFLTDIGASDTATVRGTAAGGRAARSRPDECPAGGFHRPQRYGAHGWRRGGREASRPSEGAISGTNSARTGRCDQRERYRARTQRDTKGGRG